MLDFMFAESMFVRPRYLPPSAWIGHLPFASWLVERCGPSVLVELGTHAGASYMGFCQTVHDRGLPTHCFAVDTWQGDEHAGHYGDEIYLTLKSDHDREYSGFSQLLRMTFDEALLQFADGSIDVLHIDGLHTYEAVRHDFETWLPKLSVRGVVLFHDTVVRERDFGVWKLWAELRECYPAFEFTHAHGLGVLMVGDEMPQPLRALADAEANGTVVQVRRLFESLGEAIEVGVKRLHFERSVVIRERELNDVRAACDAALEERNALIGELQAVRDDATEVDLKRSHFERLVVIRDRELSEARRADQDKRNTIAAELQAARDDAAVRESECKQLTIAYDDALASIEAIGRDLEAQRARADESTMLNNALIEARDAAERELTELHARVASLQHSYSHSIADPRAALADAESQLLSEASRVRSLTSQNEELRQRAEEESSAFQRELGAIREELAAVYASRSWRLTRGLRWLRSIFG